MVYSTEYIYKRLRNNIERVLRHIKVRKIYIKGNDKVVKIAAEK
ncbi:ribonuclease, Rne/Rng family, partial [Thermoanaerobacter ethanolicus JW 200]